MKETTYSFKSHDDLGTAIHAVKWEPDDEAQAARPVAVVQLVHGMIEYIERYRGFAQFLTDHGYVVMGHDHIGHGDSVPEPKEKEWGIMHTDHPEVVMVDDMMTNYGIIREQYPDTPLFVVGHSMGSYMLRRMLVVRSSELDDLTGAVIMGTGTVSNTDLRLAMMIIKTVSAIKGRDYKSQFVTNILFGSDYKKFNMDGTIPENSWLSKNVESVKAYYKDPKDTYLFSLNGYKGLVTAMKQDNDMEYIRRIRADLPIIFVSGADDPVGSAGKGVKTAYHKFKEAGLNAKLHLYENDRHELLQETDRENIYQDLEHWFSKHIS